MIPVPKADNLNFPIPSAILPIGTTNKTYVIPSMNIKSPIWAGEKFNWRDAYNGMKAKKIFSAELFDIPSNQILTSW